MARQILLMFLFSVLFAGDADARLWTDATGSFSVEAELVAVVDGEVQLETSGGKVITVPIAKLSKDDQAYLESLSGLPAAPREVSLNVGEEAILEVLSKPMEFAFIDMSLSDVIKHLSNSHKIPIIVDQQALDDAGVAIDTPVTFKSTGRLLRDDLDQLLKSLDLRWLTENDVLFITTPEAAQFHLLTKVYKLLGNVDVDRLEENIRKTVQEDTWADRGGEGMMSFAPGLLIISHRAPIHHQISQQFGEFLQAVPTQSVKPQKRRRKSTPEQALNHETSCEFSETPLSDVVEYLSKLHGVEISLNVRGLDDVGIADDTPVTFNLQGVRLSSALNLILQPLDLTWIVNKDSILITIHEDAESRLTVVSYPVSDLLVDGSLETLIEIVEMHAAAGSWEDQGGHCKLVIGERGTLNVTQSYAGHQQFREFLADLRRAVR
jgi:hypothetical protein